MGDTEREETGEGSYSASEWLKWDTKLLFFIFDPFVSSVYALVDESK